MRLASRPLVSVSAGQPASGDEVYSVTPHRGGGLWLATASGLVLHQEQASVLLTNTVEVGTDRWVRRARVVLEDREGRVWAGTDRGLAVLEAGRWVDVPLPNIRFRSAPVVSTLYEDRAGTLWVGSAGGLLERRDGAFRVWSTNHGLATPRVFGLAEGPDGSLWVGTQGGGLHRFRDGRFESLRGTGGFLSEDVWPLRVDADGTVWAGTPAGLHRVRAGGVRSITRRQGLHENLAYAWFEDAEGQVWTYGNRGISRMRKAELEAVADGRAGFLACLAYGESDGMPSAEGNGDQQPNAARDPGGRLWFPTTRGAVVLDPGRMEDRSLRPSVVVEEVWVDGKSAFRDGAWYDIGTAGGDAGPSFQPPPGGPLRVPPGRGRVVEVRYTANTFVDSEKARFRHRLEGHDEDWQDAETRRVAMYTNLRPGSYRFLVQARNHHGYWSEGPAVFAFVLMPRFHQQPAFKIACGLTVLLGLGGGHALRLRARHQASRRRHRELMERERNRIARDLHDELGSRLTGLALRLDAIRQSRADGGTTQQQLDDVAGALRGSVDRMREVVWTINPRCDNLESFSAYLCAHADPFLAAAGLRCRLDVPTDLPVRELAPEARHHLVMIAREALTNTVKHARASEVRIRIAVEAEMLVLELADNGHGFAPSPPAAATADANAPALGSGLGNMRARTAALGGELEIDARLGLGTRVTVRIPEEPHA